MNTKDIIDAVASRTGLNAGSSESAVKAALEIIRAQVAAGERVALAGFGTFEAHDRAGRTGRNPRTGEPLEIPASRVPVFRPSGSFREQVDNARQ